MNVGIIGGGRIVQRKYIPILGNDIKLIYEPNPETRLKLIELREKKYLSYMLMDYEPHWDGNYRVVGPLDVVVIASPTGIHLESQIMLMRHWKGPMIIEKPLATNYSEAQGLYDAEDMFPAVKIHPVFQNRMHASVQFLKHLLDTQSLGDILHVDAFLGWRRDNEYFDKHPWRMDKKQGGGIIGDHLAHVYDLFKYLIGGFHARMILRGLSHFGEEKTAPDTAFMSGRFFTSFNTSFSIFGSNAVGPRDLGTKLTVYGTKGYVELSGFFWNVVSCEMLKVPDEVGEILLRQSIEENEVGDLLVGHKKFLDRTFFRIASGDSPIVSKEDALFTISKVEEALK